MEFSWKNYFNPTPKNLQFFATSLKGIVVGLAGGTWIAGSETWVTLTIAAVGLVLDELIKFFGHVNSEEEKRVISVKVPANSVVEIKDEIKKDINASASN